MSVRKTTPIRKNPLFCAWLEAGEHRQGTVKSYDYKIAAFLAWLSDRKIDTPTIRLYADHVRLDRKLRPRTLAVVYSAVSSYCAYLKETKQLRRLPECGTLRGGRLDRPDRPVAHSEDLDLLWAAAYAMPNHTPRLRYYRLRALLVLALASLLGARREELLALDLADIKRPAKDANDPGQAEPWKLFIRDGKGGESRWLTAHPDLQAILEEWLPVRAAWCAHYGHPSDALIPVDRVRRLGEAGLSEIFRDLLARAGISSRRLTTHSFRHWFGSSICKRDGLKAAQLALGHSDIRTTDMYIHATTAQVEVAVRNLPSFRAPEQLPVPSEPEPSHPPSDHWRQCL